MNCPACCDLLSIYYLWHTENNIIDEIESLQYVVICFQSIIFDILKTTQGLQFPLSIQLWFAFNLLSLTYWKQRNRSAASVEGVVICFQSIIFDILKTTCSGLCKYGFRLWFAFNLLSLTYWKQHFPPNSPCATCCDLLSIYYLWHTENNFTGRDSHISSVVICFQSIIFDILKTTTRLESL